MLGRGSATKLQTAAGTGQNLAESRISVCDGGYALHLRRSATCPARSEADIRCVVGRRSAHPLSATTDAGTCNPCVGDFSNSLGTVDGVELPRRRETSAEVRR